MIEDKIKALGVSSAFKIFLDKIETPGDGIMIFQGMQDHTSESVKSFEGFKRAWIEEAQSFSHRSLALLRPTIRDEDSEIWASWNPRRKSDAIDEFLRFKTPDKAIVVRANWSDNPWFPSVLEDERQLDLKQYPDRYAHTWDGDYARAIEGAYFAQCLAVARQEGRIGRVAADPLLPVRAFWDIGGAGRNADAMAIWIGQWVGREIRMLDYMEGQGQTLAYHINEMRARGWSKAICHLPHDGNNTNNVTGMRFFEHVRDAGFDCPEPVKNHGHGAEMLRVEAARRLFPRIWFNEATCAAGIDTLGFYHEKRSDKREIGLGPDHDWSSHCADAFGLMCMIYEEPRVGVKPKSVERYSGSGAWMG